MTDGVHHFHKRKRIHLKKEKYPHPNKWKRMLDKIIYVVGVVGPLMTLPQLYNIWVLKNAAGVSVLSWGAYALIAVVWLIYGFAHNEKPIVVNSSLWILLEVMVVIGTLMYG